MRSLIIQPSGAQNHGFEKGNHRILCEPVGATYISEYLKSKGHESEVIYQTSSDRSVLERVRAFNPDLVGFSSMTFNFNHGRRLAAAIKQQQGDIPVVFGGYHASALPLEVGAFPEIDFVVVGEGEKTILELVNALQQGRNVSSVEGLVYKVDGKADGAPVFTGRRARISNLDELPFPTRKGLGVEQYKQMLLTIPAISEQKAAARAVQTSRGCRFSCPFCSTKNVFPGGRAERSPEKVIEELIYLQDKYGTNLVFFGDEDFFANPARIRELFERIQATGLGKEMYFRSFINARDVVLNRELLQFMHQNGYVSTLMGVESFNDKDLRSIKKGISKNSIVESLNILDDIGVLVRASVMIGYPFQDEQSLIGNLEGLLDLPIHDLYLPIFTPFPGTHSYKEWKEKGIILTENWDLYDTSHVVTRIPFEAGRLIEIRDSFLEEFFGRQSYQESIKQKGMQYEKALAEFLDYMRGIGRGVNS
jgi:anaerobic magnesium-protoporphyrin IX monomethyl ester cyclase